MKANRPTIKRIANALLRTYEKRIHDDLREIVFDAIIRGNALPKLVRRHKKAERLYWRTFLR